MPGISPERRQRLEQEKQRNASRGNFYSTKGLTHDRVRMLPLSKDEDIGTKYVYYFINGKSYVCNMETHSRPGIISKVKSALQRLDDEEAQELAKTIDEARRGKWLMKIISRKNPGKVVWYEAPKAVYQAAFNAYNVDEEDVADAEDGRDIRWAIAEGTSGKNRKYEVQLKDRSPLAADRATLDSLLAQSAKLRLSDVTAPDEAGALEALREFVPDHLWKKIAPELGIEGTSSKSKRTDGDEDADPNGAADEEDPAPVAKKKAAPVEEDDAPAPAAARRKPSPAEEDDEPQPVRRKAAPAPMADEDDEPAPVAKKKTAPPPVDEDDDLPPAPKAKGRPVTDDEDDAPPAKTTRKYEVQEDPEDDPRPAKNGKGAVEPRSLAKGQAASDEDDE